MYSLVMAFWELSQASRQDMYNSERHSHKAAILTVLYVRNKFITFWDLRVPLRNLLLGLINEYP